MILLRKIKILLFLLIGLFVFYVLALFCVHEYFQWHKYKFINSSNETCFIELSFSDKIIFSGEIDNLSKQTHFSKISNDGHYKIKYFFKEKSQSLEWGYDSKSSGGIFGNTTYIIITPEKKVFMSKIF